MCFPENCNVHQSTKFLQVHWRGCWVRNLWPFSVSDTMIFRAFASVCIPGTNGKMETIRKSHLFALVCNRVFKTEAEWIWGSRLGSMERQLLLGEWEQKHRHSFKWTVHFPTVSLLWWLPQIRSPLPVLKLTSKLNNLEIPIVLSIQG